METTIKDLILSDINTEKKEKEKKPARKPAEYETVTVSGPDFAVRKKGSKSSYMLVCICSCGQFYIKNEMTGEIDQLNSDNFAKFLSDIPENNPFNISDENGNAPFWIERLEKSKVYAECVLAFLSYEVIRKYLCKNMLSFHDFYEYIKPRRKNDWHLFGVVEDIDFTRVKTIFDCASEFCRENDLKEGLAEFFKCNNNPRGNKMFSFFFSFLSSPRSHYYQDQSKSMYDWIYDNWGVEGIKQFIRSYFETPMEYMPGNFSSLTTIQSISFSLSDFLEYFFFESSRQGYSDYPDNFLHSWDDFLGMQIEVYGKVEEKYSKHLASDEQILNYKIKKLHEMKQFENFEEAYKRMQPYECDLGKYVIKAPKTPQDMIDEGRMQSNCVASYIGRVADSETMIFFLRLSKSPDMSLVTIEIRDGRLVQVKARFNKRPTDEQNQVVQDWFDRSFNQG